MPIHSLTFVKSRLTQGPVQRRVQRVSTKTKKIPFLPLTQARPLAANPFNFWGKVIDCGDIPVTSYDNHYALQQIEEGHNLLLTRAPATAASEPGISKSGKTLPRMITLGGDHTITLPLLRSVNQAYGPISVIHFDSHLDTWKPKVFGGAPSKQAAINHGTYFYWASQEG